MSSISSRTRFLVLRRDGFRCVYCGLSSAEAVLHIDHVNAKAKGGENHIDNYVTACKTCNLGKGVLNPMDDNQTKPVAAPLGAAPSLCGKCFVVIGDDGEPVVQGFVRSKITDEVYLVQFFSWLTGEPTTMEIKPLGEMVRERWTILEDVEHLRFWLEYGPGKNRLRSSQEDEAA